MGVNMGACAEHALLGLDLSYNSGPFGYSTKTVMGHILERLLLGSNLWVGCGARAGAVFT